MYFIIGNVKKVTYRDNLNALLLEGLDVWLGGIAGHGPDLKGLGQLRVSQNRPDDGPALVARSAEDSENVGHGRY
jgi:hypothetical protein